jgi:hypothetical protein
MGAKRKCGASQFLLRPAVRAAPFALFWGTTIAGFLRVENPDKNR